MSQWKRVHLSFLLNIVICLCADAVPVRIVTLDKTGAGFQDVLVIVRSLDGKGESVRALTNQSGAVPTRELAAGLYQIIATCPYGLCQTTVREFFVKTDPIELELALDVLPTTGNTFAMGRVERRQVEVQDRHGRPVASADILVRDATAESQKWYQTGLDGRVLIDLASSRETTVVAVHDGLLLSRVLHSGRASIKQEVIILRF